MASPDLSAPADTGSRPAEAAALLRTMAETAADFTERLDSLRTRYPALGLRSADPIAVALDQAAAAAYDLHSSANSAADTIADRSAGTNDRR